MQVWRLPMPQRCSTPSCGKHACIHSLLQQNIALVTAHRFLGPWLQPVLRAPEENVFICSASVVVNYASVAVLLGSVASFACFHVFISARNVTTIELMDHLNGRGVLNHFRVNVMAAHSLYTLMPADPLQCYDVGWHLNLKQVCVRAPASLDRRACKFMSCAVTGGEGVDMAASVFPLDFTRRRRWSGLEFRE